MNAPAAFDEFDPQGGLGVRAPTFLESLRRLAWAAHQVRSEGGPSYEQLVSLDPHVQQHIGFSETEGIDGYHAWLKRRDMARNSPRDPGS